MGYGSRLYVVDKHSGNTALVTEDGKEWKWTSFLARFDLSCVGNECSELWSGGKETDCTFSGIKPNGECGDVFEDCYGMPLKEHTVKDTIRILMKGEAKEHYRRYSAPIAYLMAIDESEWDDIVVLHYGY